MRIVHGTEELAATFAFEMVGDTPTLTFDSRSGKIGTASARNPDYERGLEVILDRLASLRAVVRQVTLHPANGMEGSALSLDGFSFPLALVAVTDTHELRVALGRAQARADREPGAKGAGNPTKRIRIYLELPFVIDPAHLETQLSTGEGLSPVALQPPSVDDALAAIAAADDKAAIRPSKRVQPATSQGSGLQGPERRAVELRAVVVATEHLEAEGWTVKNVGEHESYDLACTKGDVSDLHVEVKGTTGLGERVVLTANEVAHARTHPNVALVIVSEIRLSRGVPPTADGGKVRAVQPWNIDQGTLAPLAFYWSAP